MPGTKIAGLAGLKKRLRRLKRKGKKIVFTNGCFDILHYGHVKYLQEARKKGDHLVVAVNSDCSVKKIKGRERPLVPQSDRLRTLAALECVGSLILFNEDNPLKLIREIRPDFLIKGSDWDKKGIVGATFVKSYGGKVLTINLVKGHSTSALIKKIVRTCAP